MDRQKIKSKMREALAERQGIAPAQVKDDTEIASLGLDSLDRTEWCMAIEEEFGVAIPDDDIHGARTFGELAEAVEKAMADKEARR